MTRGTSVLTIYMEKPEIPGRKFSQMVGGILSGKLQKIWAVIWDDAIFLLFTVCSADLDVAWISSDYFGSLLLAQ